MLELRLERARSTKDVDLRLSLRQWERESYLLAGRTEGPGSAPPKPRGFDVLDVAIHPILVGHGEPLFREGQAVERKLTATRSFSKIVELSYAPQH